jgi:YVTN family beta-propeller protein
MVTNVKDNSVTAIDPKTDAVIKTIFGIPMPTDVKFTPDGNYALVCSQGSASVAVIEVKSLEIKERIKTASNPITIFQDNRP